MSFGRVKNASTTKFQPLSDHDKSSVRPVASEILKNTQKKDDQLRNVEMWSMVHNVGCKNKEPTQILYNNIIIFF